MVSKERFFSATFMTLLILGAIFNEFLFVFVLLGLTFAGLYEFFYHLKKKGIPIYSYTGIVIGLLIPLSTYFRFKPTRGWELLFIVLLLFFVIFMQFVRKDPRNAIVGISTTLFGVLYVAWLFSFLVKIRYLFPDSEGMKLMGYILLVTKMSDVGALLVGSKLGRTKLLPRISPNKTVEGSLGGLVFSGVAAYFGYTLIPESLGLTAFHVVLMGIFFGGLGQMGDLSESLIKRDFDVKDSGKMLPAMGGALDAIDSVLFTAPVFYFYMYSIIN
jgi:phosphatidate cytidylyltransferase